MEYMAAPGFAGPPPHIHQRMIEIYYVLEGDLSVRIGEETQSFAPGSFVLIAPNTVHAFSNSGTKPARYLGIVSPGGFERYFDELPELIAKHGYPPPPEIMGELARKYDMIVASGEG